MITVRFPTGLIVEYPGAFYYTYSTEYETSVLYDKKDGSVVAVVRGPHAIEHGQPDQSRTAPPSPHEALTAVIGAVRDPEARERLSGRTLADLKAALRSFDARAMDWQRRFRT